MPEALLKAPPFPEHPFVSVIVRAYRRPAALLELIDRLCRQRYAPFEIVIVEQSADKELHRRVDALGDARVRLFARPPLGAPGARNEGVRLSRGDILIFIDDDDLPLGETWIGEHVANYGDSACLGVSGRLANGPLGQPPPRFPRLIAALAMKHTFMKDPRTLAFGSLRKDNIDFLLGSNSSVRRSAIDRAGGWDEGVPMGEEQSFAFRWAACRRANEQLVYDPTPVIWRRVDVPGGLDRRSGADWFLLDLIGRVIYYHGVVGHYFPRRFRLLYPLYLLRIFQQVIVWIWDADNREHSWRERLWASFRVATGLPGVVWRQGWRLRRGAIRRTLTI